MLTVSPNCFQKKKMNAVLWLNKMERVDHVHIRKTMSGRFKAQS